MIAKQLLLTLWLGFSSLGCQQAPQDPAPQQTPPPDPTVLAAQMDMPFQLPLGRSARIADQDLTVTFEEVLEDSRCPQGVDCIWQGRATIRLTLRQGEEKHSLQLTAQAGSPELAETRQGNYLLRLTDLLPYPKEGQTIPPTDYTATLLIAEPEQD
ncbi:MAG TPA: hypothetical protein VLU25_02075 [Acidobacteriota bacterium]|nr:hypothetical protein [Acidobacteriota bacterium]